MITLWQLNELRERILIVCRFQSKTTYFLAKEAFFVGFLRNVSTLLHEIFATRKFREFRDLKKSRNLSDAKIKCRENNMTRNLSDSHYVND